MVPFPGMNKIECFPIDGKTNWYLNGKCCDWLAIQQFLNDEHRPDYESYLNGKLHLEGGPASRAGNHEEWFINGLRHRKNGPAVFKQHFERNDHNEEEWWLNGEKHREDGPAIAHRNGKEEWYLHGLRHREDGPAVIYGRKKEWYLFGEYLGDTKRESQKELKRLFISYADAKRWYLSGLRHREDGPAVELITGHKEWWRNGKLHRENGPAIEHPSKLKEWYLNGKSLGEKEPENWDELVKLFHVKMIMDF